MATKIKYKPKLGVKSLGSPTLESGTHKLKAEWKIPSDLVSTKKANRATGLKIEWSVDVLNQKDPHKVVETGNENKTSSTLNLNSFNGKAGGKTKSYSRDSFHPRTIGKYLKSVTVTVNPYNSKGEGSKPQSKTRAFTNPPKPTIDAVVFNAENDGKCRSTIRKVNGTTYQEQDDIYYKRTIYTSSTKKTDVYTNTFSADTNDVSYDVTGYASLSTTDYVMVKWEAHSRGYRGNSGDTTRTFYVSYPVQATIKSVSVPNSSSSGQLTVGIDIKKSTEHPVDIVTLETLTNVTYAKASDIPNGANWEDSGAQDNGDCSAITISANGLKPDRGKHTWVRVKTTRANASSLCRYSEPRELTSLYEAPVNESADDRIIVTNVTASEDGHSAIVNLVWNDGATPSTGTELTWSDSLDTWKSTEEPNKYEFTWSDGAKTYGGRSYPNSAEIAIKGLDEATTYYVKARRYLDSDGGRTYSRYSPITGTVVPHKTPASVVAVCDRYAVTGKSLDVRWTLSGSTMQTAWKIISTNGKDLGSGRGSLGATQIDARRLANAASGGTVSFRVYVSTGSEFKPSNICTVSIVDKPTLLISVPSTMTAQSNFSFAATCNRPCELIVIVTSQGIGGQTPTGVVNQADGDTIYSNKYSPSWTASGSSYTRTITLPTPLEFIDKGSYTISVTAVDVITGLKSDTVQNDFAVNWAHQAVSPENSVRLFVIDEYDSDGEHKQAVRITLTPPTGSVSSDVYDIYRMDVDHPTLIGEGYPLTYPPAGSTIVLEDIYAPFGGGYANNYRYDDDLYYRVALRTADGDTEFADIAYEAPNTTMRFDWADGTLELPYGNQYGDSYSKDFELRHHMDGSNDGYWNQNVERKSSLNSSIIKLIQPDDIRKAKQLARYAGPVFVRLPDGSAFEADVQVTDLSRKNDAVTQIAIDATEIGLTTEFKLPNPYQLEQEE